VTGLGTEEGAVKRRRGGWLQYVLMLDVSGVAVTVEHDNVETAEALKA
jgi:hypothetical protein